MTIINRYKGFDENEESTIQRRNRDSDFGPVLNRDLISINSNNSSTIKNSYSSRFVNRFGASTQYNTNELQIVQSVVTESIHINGITVRYMPRKSDYTDEIWNEKPESVFDRGLLMDMLLTSTAGFEGEGDIMTQYGIEFREEVILKLSIPRFESLYKSYQESNPEYKRRRPLEGDLIVIPFGISSLNNNQYFPKFFEITRVTTYHDGAFFQMGDNYQYKIRARLFELSYEKFGYQPNPVETDLEGNDSDVITKAEKQEQNKITIGSDGKINITDNSNDVTDVFGDNRVIEQQSQEREVYDYEGKKLKDKPKVITNDYTAKAFGYSNGIINNLDEL